MSYKTFIIVLILSFRANSLLACWYYLLPEEKRFSLIKPEYYSYNDFLSFNYNSNLFYQLYDEDNLKTENIYDPNILLWQKKINFKAKYQDVYDVIYSDSFDINQSNIHNSFVEYLLKYNKNEIIEYIKYARNCNDFNSNYDDPWERNEHILIPRRGEMIKVLKNKIHNVKDKDLKKRYAFLITRLMYYNNDFAQLQSFYQENFKINDNKDIIDYWALYFYAITLKDNGYKNYLMSILFQKCKDKRLAIFKKVDNQIPIQNALKFARNNQEKINLWFLYSLKKSSFSLSYLEKVNELNHNSREFSFLLLREINKLEDQYFTPYFTHYEPSIIHQDLSYIGIRLKIKSAKLNANKLLFFLKKLNSKRLENRYLYHQALGILYLIADSSELSLFHLNQALKNKSVNKEITKQTRLYKTLAFINQNGILNNEAKINIMTFSENNLTFLFACAKMLEYKGNFIESMYLLSKIKEDMYYSMRSYKSLLKGIDHYTTNYKEYIDLRYSQTQIQSLLNNMNVLKKNKYNLWKSTEIVNDYTYFTRLIAVKYLRENNLNQSIRYFKLHEKIQAKPNKINKLIFFNNFYSNPLNSDKDSIHYNESEVLELLKKYIIKSNTNKEVNKDYYSFLIGNCYYNMTYYGRNWQMKRENWSYDYTFTILKDDAEYFQCNLAKFYYLKAYRQTKDKKFAAVCLRLASICERNKIIDNYYRNFDFYSEINFDNNQLDFQLKKKFPEDYKELKGDCMSFYTYIKERKLNFESKQ